MPTLMELELEWPDDFNSLHPASKRWALKLLAALRTRPLIGKPLHDGGGRYVRQGLVGCRRIRPSSGNKTRIVYRILPSEQRPLSIEVVAIGPRGSVYETASARMRAKRQAA